MLICAISVSQIFRQRPRNVVKIKVSNDENVSTVYDFDFFNSVHYASMVRFIKVTNRQNKTQFFLLSNDTSMAKIAAPLRTLKIYMSSCILDLTAITTPTPNFLDFFGLLDQKDMRPGFCHFQNICP